MELRAKNLRGKALGLVSFGTRPGVQKGRFCPCLAMEISRIRVMCTDAGDGRLRRVPPELFCEQSLGKVGLRSRAGAKKALLYYDTDIFG
jgi:hypothetical protein